MLNPNSELKIGIRDVNPCKNCKREWKRPGCHDACPDRKPWVEELERVKAARKAYETRMGYR